MEVNFQLFVQTIVFINIFTIGSQKNDCLLQVINHRLILLQFSRYS